MPSRKFRNFSHVMVVGKNLSKMGILYGKAGGGSFLLLPTSYKENFGWGILVMDIRWLKYYNRGGKRLTLTSQIAFAEHDSRMLLRKDLRK